MNINTDLIQFRKGVHNVCRLFKTLFQKDRNILLYKNNVIYINNINQLCSLKSENNNVYNFAINYTLTQIQNFRENICINPIMYILAFEQLFDRITDLRELEKYDFSKIVDFLKWYYSNSNLSKAIVTNEHIKKLFFKEYQDNFLAKVIDVASNPSNVEIIESKHNTIIKHKYYKLKARYLTGPIYNENCKLFITNVLTKELFYKLINLKLPILVICNSTDFEVQSSYLLTILNISETEMMKYYTDLCLLTGFGKGFQNLDVDELNNYSFGDVKEFKFVDGQLYISSNVYLKADELQHLNKKETLDRYYALQGKNITIHCVEEYLEKVRCIVSTIKSLQHTGIFYIDTKTLRLLIKSLEDDKDLKKFIMDLLRAYLNLFQFDNNTIDEVIDNGDLSASFNVNTGKYDDEIFTSLDYYLNIFALLDSNVKTLSKLY